MTPLRHILCTIDFSRHTDAVFDMGVRLAAGFGARLILFHAVNFPSDVLHNSDAHERTGKRRHMTRQAEARLRELMTGTTAAGDVHVGWGDPVEALERAVDETGADMIVAARHGLSGVQRMLMGTVIERAVRKIDIPILVLPPQRGRDSRLDPDRFRCIVAACGPDPRSDSVQRFAWDMAHRFRAQLHLVHALERPVDEEILDPTTGPYATVQEDLRRRIRWFLIDALSDLAQDPHSIQTAVEPGSPQEVLVDYARRQSADMVIVGVRRLGAVRKSMVGSTTEALLRKAPCAILTLPSLP